MQATEPAFPSTAPAKAWHDLLDELRQRGVRPERQVDRLQVAGADAGSAVAALAQGLFTRAAHCSGVENLFGPPPAVGPSSLPVPSLGLVTEPPVPSSWRRVFGGG